MSLLRFLAPVLLGLALGLAPGIALAQEMPANHGGATSAPLFVADLPAGTVSVRLARPSMTDAIPGTAVVGNWTTPDGKKQANIVSTGDDGRAIFSGIPAGSSFRAEATVEGEHLVSAQFPVPGEGGTRLLMIVGAQAAEAMNDMTGAASSPHAGKPAGPQMVGLRAGKVEGKDGLPAGTVDLRLVGADGQALTGVKVALGHVEGKTASVVFVDALSDSSGHAHFDKLKTGSGTQYAAVIEREGMRIGTDAFTLDDQRGATGELRIPGRTHDLGVLRISSSSRMMVELREDAIGVLQNLIVENTSDKIFDPGPAGLLIPLPDGFAGAEKLPGGAEVEIKEGVGVFLRSILPPTQPTAAPAQVRVGYVLTTHEQHDFDIVQPMPVGMQGGLVLVPADYTIALSAPGLRARANERDDSGNELRLFDLDAIQPGHALRLTVHGLPTHDETGKWIAGILVVLLILAGGVAAARSRVAVPAVNKAG
jgi:hypothetical protein